MKFNLINPSDAYHFEAPDLKIAALVCGLLGQGRYLADGLDDAKGQCVPPFLFGGSDEWFTQQFGAGVSDTFEDVMANRPEELAQAFESVTLTNPPRSSLNDIGCQAKGFAERLREIAADKKAAE